MNFGLEFPIPFGSGGMYMNSFADTFPLSDACIFSRPESDFGELHDVVGRL